MKRIVRFFSISVLAILLGFCVVLPVSAGNQEGDKAYYSETSDIYLNAPDPIKDLLDMQNKITLSLSRENVKYVYDLISIRKIVDEFDFSEVNQLLNQTWTNESFFEEVIKGISEAEFPAIQTLAYTKGPMCNVDKKDSIWNSRREYRKKIMQVHMLLS